MVQFCHTTILVEKLNHIKEENKDTEDLIKKQEEDLAKLEMKKSEAEKKKAELAKEFKETQKLAEVAQKGEGVEEDRGSKIKDEDTISKLRLGGTT